MPTTRKKVIKTVYKDEDDSEADNAVGDFSDSGSEAEIPEQSSSEEDVEAAVSSSDEFNEKSKKILKKPKPARKHFAKEFIGKINRQSHAEDEDVLPVLFSVKDLTDEDKLLPSVLNLSESDSSEDESAKLTKNKLPAPLNLVQRDEPDSDAEPEADYKDVWSQNIQDNSEEIAKKTFMELEQHKNTIEKTKASILNYTEAKVAEEHESNVQDLLALGEEVLSPSQTQPEKKRRKTKKQKDDSDSEMEDWEEVKEAKPIPQQGIQLVLQFPDGPCRKSKKLDIEMMMKRKMNRVKKEYQVYMHKVHVLCWLGHGNYVSKVLNDQEILAAALSLVPSKGCYPGQRVDMKYLEQITTWFKDKLILKQDKNEEKFRPKAPPLKDILLKQVKSKVVTTKKYLMFIFVSMLRALGLQCRIMFNLVTLPLKPPASELCSLSTKPKTEKKADNNKDSNKNNEKNQDKKKCNSNSKSKGKITQMDGNFDSCFSDDSDMDNIMQLDGNDDVSNVKTRSRRVNKNAKSSDKDETEDVSPPKRAKKSPSRNASKNNKTNADTEKDATQKRTRVSRKGTVKPENKSSELKESKVKEKTYTSNPKTKTMDVDESENYQPSSSKNATKTEATSSKVEVKKTNLPKITVTNENNVTKTSKYFNSQNQSAPKSLSLRKRSLRSELTSNSSTVNNTLNNNDNKTSQIKVRTRSVPESVIKTSQYFKDIKDKPSESKRTKISRVTKKDILEDKKRVSHRDIVSKSKVKPENDVTGDLVNIIKKRVKDAKEDTKKRLVKGKVKQESDEDSDHLPVESSKRQKAESDDDFKPTKISPKASTSRVSAVKRIDRRVLSSDTEEVPSNKCNIWCEVFVEELEQWIAVDVIRAKVHCAEQIYSGASHPVCYVLGWDNNNYLKDLTRRYVPHWNTVTRKQRAEPSWVDTALRPWLGPKTAREREEDEQLNRMQLEAPLPKSISEYKNHPLYALKRHLLKFEAIYPPDAATLGFVRGEAVFARECVHVCRSRDTWLKEAKVVRLGEQPYKVVKARPKWDRLSNKLITDKPLEVFGPWQVQDYEPPTAENGIVPRNAYGNVELFKDCMLPKGTVHVKLPGLNRVAKKLNIDCAPAMTGFDFNGGWSHPVYDGFVVCSEYEQLVTEAWLKDQEDQERREREKIEARVYGNWRRLIKGLLIKERLKNKYGFQDPALPTDKKKKGPRLVVKKT